MKLKQKLTNLTIPMILAPLVCGTIFATSLQGALVYAQVGIDCSELSGEALRACEANNAEVNENITEEERKRNQAAADERAGDGAKECAGVRTSIISGDICDAEGESGVIFELLKWVLRIMTAGVGIAAVGGIAYGALLYTTAENKPEQTKKAIGVITNVVIGIVAYALMAVFLNFLIPGGIFS